MQPFAYARPATLAEAVDLLVRHGGGARVLAGGTDLVIRLRDGSYAPSVVVDVKRVPRAGAGDPGRRGRRARHRRDDDDDRDRGAPGHPARHGRARRGGRGRGLRPDPEPRDARREPRQRLAGGRHRAGAPRPRRDRRRGRASRAPGGSRSTRSSSGPGVTALGPGELVAAVELPAAAVAHRERPPAPDAPPRPRPRVGDGRLRRGRGRRHAARVRVASGPRPVLRVDDDRHARGSRGATTTTRDALLEAMLADATPVGDLDARRARVPPRDAPGPRAAGARRSRSSAGERRGRAMAPIADAVADRARRQRRSARRRRRAAHTLLDALRDDLA